MGTNIHEEVDHFTQEGHKALGEGKIDDACGHFDKAVTLASQMKEGFTERACFFNLGACCVAQGDSKRGLEYLRKALPPDRDSDGSANYADLQYNLGLAYDGLSQLTSSIECYQISLQEYRTQNNQEMQAETLGKLAIGSSKLGDVSKAAEYYGEAAEVFKSLGDKMNQVLALTSQASLLGEIEDIENCAKVLQAVIEMCEKLTDSTLQGKIYNDLGLLYNRLKSYTNAIECFEIALPLISGVDEEKQLEAVLRQNLGAVYNQIKRYKKAVQHHKVALRLHGELGNRLAEGQTACNMAFAYSQLKDFDSAIGKFLLAIQAAKDTNDQCSHWQANEGLAAVYFLKGYHKKAVRHYKIALSSLSTSGAMTTNHNERIINKLADAMKFLLANGVSGSKKKRSVKRRTRGGVSDETDEGSTPRLVGKTRVRADSNHKLIARGIDGEIDESSDSNSDEFSNDSSSGSDETETHKDRKKVRYIKPSWDKKAVNNSLTVNSRPGLLLSGPYQNLIKNRNSHSDINDGYEEPVDEHPKSHPTFSDMSLQMPRAHREAYLASIAASTSTPKKSHNTPPPRSDESSWERKHTNQSKTCVIQ